MDERLQYASLAHGQRHPGGGSLARKKSPFRPIYLVPLLAATALVAVAVAWLIAHRLDHAAETRATIKLAACIDNNMVPNLPAKGEFLINQACRLSVRAGATGGAAGCVLSQRGKLVSDEAAEALGRQCGLPVPER
jgi:hypothetical protein